MACRDDSERAEILEEIELLQAIYVHELELEGFVERPTSLTLSLHPSTGDGDHNLKYVCLSLCFKIPADYPFVIPGISILNPRGLSDVHINSIQENLLQLAKEKAGSPMLYDLIEYTKECLSDNNIPSCPCVICLEHFHEESSFIKTNCYHYFHSLCLRKYVDHFLCENEKILCPMCRFEIEFERGVPECEMCVPPDEEFVYKPDTKQQKAQLERQRILKYQREKGGVINIEEERNKYFIGIKDMKKEESGVVENLDVNTQREKIVSGKKDESLNTRKEERERSREPVKGRGRERNWKWDQDGKNKVNNRNYQMNRNKTGGRREKDEVRKESDHGEPKDLKNENFEKRDRVCPRGSERDHRGRYGDTDEDVRVISRKESARGGFSISSRRQENSRGQEKNVKDFKRKDRERQEDKTEDVWVISDKEERARDGFSGSSRRQENSRGQEKNVKDFERKDRSFQSKTRRQKRCGDKDEARNGREGTDEGKVDWGKVDCTSLIPPCSNRAEPLETISRTRGACDVNSTSSPENNHLTCRGDVKIFPPKNFRKRPPRKRPQDNKDTSKTGTKCPSKILNTSANTSDSKTERTANMNEWKSPKDPSRGKRGSCVKDDHLPIRTPPGFKSVAPPPGFKSIAPPAGFKSVSPPPGFKSKAIKDNTLL